MRLTRSFVDMPLSIGHTVALPESVSAHLTRVLRLGLGARIVLFNGDGNDYNAEISALGKKFAEAEVLSVSVVNTESPLQLVLAQAIARGEKMDFVLQKATELGVTGVIPLVTERTEVRLDAERGDKRRTHWRGVMASACEQSGRARLPALGQVTTLSQWLGASPETGLDADRDNDQRLPMIYLDPEAEHSIHTMKEIAPKGACFVIGPEGGLGDRDLAQLNAAGAIGVRLGPRILRTETAGLAILAALQGLYGDF